MPMVNLDTHILLFALEGSLRKKERDLLSSNDWSASAIVLWEIAKLAQLGRIVLDFEDPTVQNVFKSLHIWPIDLKIARQSCSLDINSDPADEIIAATSICHNVPLLTRDKNILASKIVPFV